MLLEAGTIEGLAAEGSIIATCMYAKCQPSQQGERRIGSTQLPFTDNATAMLHNELTDNREVSACLIALGIMVRLGNSLTPFQLLLHAVLHATICSDNYNADIFRIVVDTICGPCGIAAPDELACTHLCNMQ